MALCATCCHSLWLKRILTECQVKFSDPITIWCDNKLCLAIAKNPMLHGRTKHIDVKLHFIRELVTENKIKLNFCSTENQLADIFTKCLDSKKFCRLREQLGICSLQSRGRIDGVIEDMEVASNQDSV